MMEVCALSISGPQVYQQPLTGGHVVLLVLHCNGHIYQPAHERELLEEWPRAPHL